MLLLDVGIVGIPVDNFRAQNKLLANENNTPTYLSKPSKQLKKF